MVIGQEFYLYDFDWNVKVFYVVDNIPMDYIIRELEFIGCSSKDIEEVSSNLSDNSKNRGVTYSNTNEHESIIIIGETSCPEEFQHTFDHEKCHLAMHIAKIYNINPYSEKLAYLIGDIGLEMFPVAKRFLCEHCREKMK